MKKQLMTIGALCAATIAIYAASDRLDIFDKAGNFVSVMVDDIKSITLGEGNDADGFTTVNVSTTYGDKSCEISSVDKIAYTPVDESIPNEIATSDAPNARVVILDWRNNSDYGDATLDPDKPADWHGCYAGNNPHFIIKTDKGFSSTFGVRGQYTGKSYSDADPNFIFWSDKDSNLLGADCYSFWMPFEPVVIYVNSEELTTYEGKPFLGTYTGAVISTGDGRLVHKAAVSLNAEFKANGTYVMKTTDSHNFDFLDLYTWDEEKNTFEYVPYDGPLQNEIDLEVKTGVKGRFAEGDMLFADFHNIVTDKPENTVHYIAAKSSCDYTVAAADDFDNRLLIQAMPTDGGKARYYYIEYSGTPTEVAMEFVSGSNIGESSTAFASAAGEKLFKYENKGDGNPVFTFRGAEYGTYTGAGDALALDGFGELTLGQTVGTYSVSGGLVTATIGSETRIFVIDKDARTYTEMTADVWDGQPQYTKEDAVGAYAAEDQASESSMTIDFDKNFAGNDAPGTASIRFKVKRHDGFGNGWSDLIASSGSYIYNAASKTIVITNVYMGTSATTSGRRNIVLKVSDDLLSMWIDNTDEDRIYGSGRDGSYLLTGETNTLTAPAPAIELAAKYTGTPNMVMYTNTAPTDATLTFDTATSKAKLNVIGMGTALVDQEVTYTLEGNTVTLVDIDTYPNGAYVAVKENLVFTIQDNGELTSTQSIAGKIGSLITVDFSSAPLKPVQ